MTGSRSAPHIRGELLLARFAFVREVHGSEALRTLLAVLPPEDQRRLEGVSGQLWYPFRLLNDFDRAIGAKLAPGDPRIFERLGAASARQRTMALEDVAALVSVHGFLTRTAEEHRRFHSFGRAEYRRIGFEHGEISYSEYPEPDVVYCQGGLGYLRAAVEMLAGSPVAAAERECQCRGDRSCVFTLQWTRSGPKRSPDHSA